MATVSADLWSSGDAYERYVGRWSRLTAREFLTWLAIPDGQQWLDVGCGTGALTQTILDSAAPSRVQGVDASASYVEFARARVQDPRASFEVGDAQSLPLESDSVDVIVSGLALNFIPQPSVALAEMARIVRRGGGVGVYVWDYAGKMELMRHFWDAAVELDARVSLLDEGNRFPICCPENLEALFRQSPLERIEVVPIDVPTRFRDFDDYWTPFLGAQGPAPGHTMSLAEDQRTELRERIRDALPISADGSIELVARAWAARGART